MIPRELLTERLLLRQWRDGDAEGLAEIYSQPEFLEHNSYRDPNEQVARFAWSWEEDGFSLWASTSSPRGGSSVASRNVFAPPGPLRPRPET